MRSMIAIIAQIPMHGRRRILSGGRCLLGWLFVRMQRLRLLGRWSSFCALSAFRRRLRRMRSRCRRCLLGVGWLASCGGSLYPLRRALNSSNDATKQTNWFDEGKADDLSAKNLLGAAARKSSSKDDAAPDGIYRGLANQTSYIQRNPDAPNRAVGPIKAPSNIRTITITDMAPDTCKDCEFSSSL